MPGETDFDDPDALDETAAFRDDETTRWYIDTAVCKNIQHSLACFQNGNYFRHLRELYEANELTSAINRIIESTNHQFLIRILISKFKSHDFGSAAQILQKQTDPEMQTDMKPVSDRFQVKDSGPAACGWAVNNGSCPCKMSKIVELFCLIFAIE